MPDIAAIVQAGAANPWLYLPLAVLLGALHALEPGHSKSMMAAFIVTTRGTPAQAALLGGSAAIGHTLVVWALAALGLYLGDRLILDKAEPWLILVSGLLIVGLRSGSGGSFAQNSIITITIMDMITAMIITVMTMIVITLTTGITAATPRPTLVRCAAVSPAARSRTSISHGSG